MLMKNPPHLGDLVGENRAGISQFSLVRKKPVTALHPAVGAASGLSKFSQPV
jgi:hypothetical protein